MIENDKDVKDVTIGLVGPCAAGKTTIANLLKNNGFRNVRQIAQEHSFVQNMWKKISNPDILIFLDVTYDNSFKRRPQNWTIKDYNNQVQRLTNARENADLYVDTNNLTINQVFDLILEYLLKINAI